MHLFKIMQKSLTFWNSEKWTIKKWNSSLIRIISGKQLYSEEVVEF